MLLFFVDKSLTGLENVGKIPPLLLRVVVVMGLEELKCAGKVVGLRATERAIQRGNVKKIYLAMDVEKRIRERIEGLAKERQIEVEYVSSAETLGRACGIEVASSCAALLNSSESEKENVSK